MDIQLFLLDNDGVMIDTEGAAVVHDLPFFKKYGLEFTLAEYAALMSGKARAEFIRLVEEHRAAKNAPSLPDDFYFLLRKEHEAQVEDGRAGRVPGSERLLRYIGNRPKEVISNGDMDAMIHKLIKVKYYDQLKGHIHNPQSAGCSGKPEPDMIYHAMRKCGVTDSSKVVFYGDSAFDMKAGKKAGTYTIGYSGGVHRPSDYHDDLMDNGATIVFPTMDEIVRHTRQIDDGWTKRTLRQIFGPKP